MHSHVNKHYAAGALGRKLAARHNAAVDRIKRLRKAAGLTQAELAEKAGLDQSFVSRLERGKTGISVASLQSLAYALGVPTAQLLEPGSPESRLLQAVERVPESHLEIAADMLELLLSSLPEGQKEKK